MCNDPQSLFHQNALPDDLIQAFESNGWSLDDIATLLQTEGVSSDYVTKVAKTLLAKHKNGSEDSLEVLLEIISNNMLKETEPMVWVNYGGTKVRVLNPYFTSSGSHGAGESAIGLRLWEAEICTLEWLDAHSDMVKGRSVLELGAGVGLAGLACVEQFGAAKVTLTDSSPTALHNLKVIAECSSQPQLVNVERLDWFDVDILGFNSEYSLLLGADCVYDPNDISAIANTLEAFFRKNPNALGILACSIRNRATFDKMLEKLDLSSIIEYKTSQIPESSIKYSTNVTHVFTKRWSRSNVAISILTNKNSPSS